MIRKCLADWLHRLC